ncbi:hypothetical protein CYY_010117 [Polysphondylium violaceum]|uniref:Uncharacterized protein n=1 Tax=Polysphondylium violaceum TaxID=133409 RepID=A0A8J4PLV9_9MYCE|nr:hypothetical protein CYY_010117 [Polysphondylium violaceum]
MDIVNIVSSFQSSIFVVDKKNKIYPPWDWVCRNILILLQDFSECITKAIARSELQNKWDTDYKNKSSTTAVSTTTTPRGLSYYIDSNNRSNDIPFDAIIHTNIKSIQQTNGQDIDKIQQLILADSIDSDQNQLSILLHPRFYKYLDIKFGKSSLISENRKIRLTNIIKYYSHLTKQQEKEEEKEIKKESISILYPTEIIGFIINDQQELSQTERSEHFDLSSIFLKDRVPDQTSILWLKVESIGELQDRLPAPTSNASVPWSGTIPMDQFLQHSYSKQIVKVIDSSSNSSNSSNSNITIDLVFWNDFINYINLFNIGDFIRIDGIYYNQILSNHNHIVLEFTPTSILSILPSSSSSSSFNNPDHQPEIQQYNSIINNNNNNNSNNRVLLNSIIKDSMVSVLCNVYFKDQQIIIQEIDSNHTFQLKCDSNETKTKLATSMQNSQLIYFENLLFTTTNSNNKEIIYNNQSTFKNISTMNGVLNCGFINSMSLQYINHFKNIKTQAQICKYNYNGITYNHKQCNSNNNVISSPTATTTTTTTTGIYCNHCKKEIDSGGVNVDIQLQLLFTLFEPNSNFTISNIESNIKSIREILSIKESEFIKIPTDDKKLEYLDKILDQN